MAFDGAHRRMTMTPAWGDATLVRAVSVDHQAVAGSPYPTISFGVPPALIRTAQYT
jgi:hypothetical protein